MFENLQETDRFFTKTLYDSEVDCVMAFDNRLIDSKQKHGIKKKFPRYQRDDSRSPLQRQAANERERRRMSR